MDASPKLIIRVSFERDGNRQIVRITFEGQLTKTDDSHTSTVGAMESVFRSVKDRELEISQLIFDLQNLTFIDERAADELVVQMRGLAAAEVRVLCLEGQKAQASRLHRI